MINQTNGKVVNIQEIEQNVHKVEFASKNTLFLIGTAHISEESVKLVEKTIKKVKPDNIALELDEERFEALQNKKKYENLDIINIIRKGQLFFLIGQFILASYQKKLAKKTGVSPGSEFLKAIEIASVEDIDLVLADRNIGTTLKRAWRITSTWKKIRMFFSFLFSAPDEKEELDIEDIKKQDAISELVDTFGKELPTLKKILIDERDIYLSYHIRQNLRKTTVAVVGAGHVPGILQQLQREISSTEIEEINTVPEAQVWSKLIPWSFPLLVLILFIWGFSQGDYEKISEAFYIWVVVNGALTAIACVFTLAHPLTILAGFIAAPITSLNPTIGAGFVTAFVQAVLVKPRILDLQELTDFQFSVANIYRNRVTKIFIVFFFSSLGSSIGTFVAIPYISKLFL